MFTALLAAALLPAADPAVPSTSTKEALQPLNPLVGSWKGTGYPDGTLAERQNGFWTETITIGWKFPTIRLP